MKRWAGAEVRKARALWRPRLPWPCSRCGKPVIADPAKKYGGWHVDHWPIPYEFGGTQTAPAHDACNLSAGGKRGAEITNGRRAAARTYRVARDDQGRNIRGV